MAENPTKHPLPLVVVIPTRYVDLNDLRYLLALDCCRAAVTHEIPLVVVDNSPDASVRQAFTDAGTDVSSGTSWVTVIHWTRGRKGAALREGIRFASEERFKDNAIFIGFQEPEKVDMMRNWKAMSRHMQTKNLDICAAWRKDETFRNTYPMEQYHSETFANLHLNAVAAQNGFPSKIDWTSGPIMFHSKWAPAWLACDGEMWDAQMIPMIRAHYQDAATVGSYEIDFHHPASMKKQEEGVPEWNEKRLLQLNLLFDIVGKELRKKGNTS